MREVLTIEDVAELAGEDSVLHMNMSVNNWSAVVRCRTGNFQPFDPERQEMLSTVG